MDRTGIKARKYHPQGRDLFVHTVIDDYTRLAYAEIHDDEKAITAVGVLYRAVAWFAERGVVIERVLSDNGSAYRSHLWRDSLCRSRHHAQEDPATSAADQRQDRTLAPHHGRRVGLQEALPLREQPDEPHWQDGSTSTTTTGPTRH